MKIVDLLGMHIPLTNEEQEFMSCHMGKIKIASLVERDEIVAHNLVRKGLLEISNDSQFLFRSDENTPN
tara:strand:- start:268 stop:474 length:207 start_codon:yes stop_codon:yes gene_type:complete